MHLKFPLLLKQILKLKLFRISSIVILLFAVTPLCSVQAYQERVALLIGLEQYEKEKARFGKLPFAGNDLEAVGKALEKADFDPIYIYTDSDIPDMPLGSPIKYLSLLPADGSASTVSSNHLNKAISGILKGMKDKQDSLLLIYFTGHGGTFLGRNRVLALPNSDSDDPHSFSQVQVILEQMERSAKGVHKMLVIDACADDLGEGPPPSINMIDEELPVHLYSSKLKEVSFFDNTLEMSVFTHYFVQALKHSDSVGFGNRNGKIESEEIKYYVQTFVPKHNNRKQKKTDLKDTEANETLEQHPWGSGKENLVLGKSPQSIEVLSRKPGESEESFEARQSAVTKAHYGEEK